MDDLIDGMLALMENPAEFTGPVNLRNPDEFTIRELSEKAFALNRARSTLSFHPLSKDDPTQRRPDIELAQHEPGWEPTVALQEGLERTVAHFTETLE